MENIVNVDCQKVLLKLDGQSFKSLRQENFKIFLLKSVQGFSVNSFRSKFIMFFVWSVIFFFENLEMEYDDYIEYDDIFFYFDLLEMEKL